jgi:outer membrane protein
MTMKKLLPVGLLSGLLLLGYLGRAQDKWDLRRCVEYAVTNNISVKQADVQARLAALTLQQSKLGQLPTLNFTGSSAYNSGRNQDPTNFSLITTGYFSSQYALQAGVNLFNFGSLQSYKQSSGFAFEASKAAADKLRNDISLSVANAYLQFLLSVQQSRTAQNQLQQSQAQLELTRKQVRAGSLPELNAAELESQVAQDSASYLSAASTIQQNVLNLKAYMSLDAAAPFELDTPSVDKIPIERFDELQPEIVYSLALRNQPQQRADHFQILSAQKYVDYNHAAMLPTFSLFGNLATGYGSQNLLLTGVTLLPPPTNAVGIVNAGAATDSVYSILPGGAKQNTSKQAYFSQLNQDFRQAVGIQINVPILNGGSLKINYAKSKENLRNYQLQQQLDNLTLKQNIYQAYNLAMAALQKFEANKVTVEATGRSYDYAQKRYKVGMSNTLDLLTQQNNFFTAQINLLYSQFDYVFKMKVLEFYKGMGIKL